MRLFFIYSHLIWCSCLFIWRLVFSPRTCRISRLRPRHTCTVECGTWFAIGNGRCYAYGRCFVPANTFRSGRNSGASSLEGPRPRTCGRLWRESWWRGRLWRGRFGFNGSCGNFQFIFSGRRKALYYIADFDYVLQMLISPNAGEIYKLFLLKHIAFTCFQLWERFDPCIPLVYSILPPRRLKVFLQCQVCQTVCRLIKTLEGHFSNLRILH